MTPRIIVVDDSLTVRMHIGEALEAAGFDVIPCADLRHARLALHEPCALVVLDLVLPDGDGLDFLRELKKSPATARTPVMMLSTEAEVRSRIRGIDAGADDYIGKPYDVGQFVARVRALTRTPVVATSTARRVLVIDDSVTFRNQLADALSAAGYLVEQAATGEEGLAVAALVRPDAVVVDGVLPGIDGAAVIRRLKSDAALRDAPCVLLTAAEGVADELRSLDAGADAHLRKSDDIGLILARLAALLRGASTPADASSSLLGPKRLLAIDDSITYLEALGAELRVEGYDVVLATSGEEGLDLLLAQHVDCILLDLMMPGLSGQDTCRRIKESPAWRDIPLVMLTARDDRAAMIDGINAGADDYIAKSSDFDVLKARLRAQLRRKHFEDENRRIRDKLVRRETEARFQRLLQSNIIGVILAELGGRMTEANDAFLAMLGYSRVDLEAGAIEWSKITPSEWLGLDRVAAEQLRATGSSTTYEKEYLRKDGTRLPALVGSVMLEGETNTFVGFVLDRTEQKLAELKLHDYAVALEESNRELVRARDRAEQESRFKSSFLANMSHELRTPLNAIIGFSELLEQQLFGPLNETQLECVQNVLSAAHHLLTLVNDVLDLAKIESGKMELACEWTALESVIEASQRVIKPLAANKGIAVSISVPPELPELHIDPVRIKQVLCNLLSNAIKFTPRQGSVRLVVLRSPEQLEVSCTDSGIGIRAEDLPRLFREFEQLEQGADTKPEGTGLGLALTKRIVELHGGTIRAASEHGVGSTFTFTLPVHVHDVAGGG